MFISLKLLLIVGKKMHEAAINPIKNYFADRQHTKKVLDDIEKKVIKSKCFYCKKCENCKKFETYRNEFIKKGFWLFNKEIKYWDVFDPDWSYRNRVFNHRPIRATNFRM